jgi:phage shock protein E
VAGGIPEMGLTPFGQLFHARHATPRRYVAPMTRSLPLLVALLAGLLALTACAEERAPSAAPVPPDALAALLAREDAPLLLDVRTRDEFAQGHVPGATLVPIDELPARLGELEGHKQRGVVAYCESGGRASKAAELLRAHGFTGVRLLDGSMRRWRDEQREVATGS